MVSGAGRSDTRAVACCPAGARHEGVRVEPVAMDSASASTSRSPSLASRGPSSASAARRSAGSRQAVSRAMIVARHSLVSPARRAASVAGSSAVSAWPAHQPRPPVRRLPASQRNLGADALTHPVGRDTGRPLPGALGGYEVGRHHGLCRRCGGLQLLQQAQLADALGVVDRPVQPGQRARSTTSASPRTWGCRPRPVQHRCRTCVRIYRRHTPDKRSRLPCGHARAGQHRGDHSALGG